MMMMIQLAEVPGHDRNKNSFRNTSERDRKREVRSKLRIKKKSS